MNVLTVSQLNRYVKALIEEDAKLRDLYIKGEISNFTHHYQSGHFYFSLKDEGGAVRAVMFKGHASALRFMPENGMAVLVRASAGVFERDGAYQLYVTDMQPDGAGARAVAFEQLKRRLAAQGMFDEARKRPIPQLPKRVGVVTSQTGAALQDIVSVIARRYPLCGIALCPAQVQGDAAAASITASLRHLDENGNCDVLILARGGGSAEDLWAFNDEGLAKAVFESKTPVVSAVGHEVDYTICDFVADFRAPTPSAAAELVTPAQGAVALRLESCRLRMAQAACSMVEDYTTHIKSLKQRKCMTSPMDYVVKNKQRLDFFAQSLYNKSHMNLCRSGEALHRRAELLESLSPLAVLARGYAVVFRDGKAAFGDLKPGDKVRLRLRDGEAKAAVLEWSEYPREEKPEL